MKVKHIALGLVGVAMVSGSGNIKQEVATKAEANANRSQFNKDLQGRKANERLRNRESEQLSPEAVNRIKGGFIPVVDAKTGLETVFVEGNTVILRPGDNRIMGDGTVVANSMGETGIVKNGMLTDIIRVGVNDKAEYDRIWNLATGLNPQ